MEEKKKGYGLKAVILVAVVSLILGVMVTANFDGVESTNAEPFWKEGRGKGNKKSVVKRVEATAVAVTGMPSFVELAERLTPSVVNISTTHVVKGRGGSPFPGFKGGPFEDFFGDDFFKEFFGDRKGGEGGGKSREFKRQSLGSGFVINKEGYILTNNHVIENATEIIVNFSEKKKDYKATVIGQDKKLDVALIKINSENHLNVAALGDSESLKIGEWVMAIGNPFGLGGTVTAGIVSQKGRIIGAGPYDNFIQTDASINPGNSGGPLFNMAGEVVGINTAIIAGGQGIGFATPINIIKDSLKQLKDKGHITRGWMGVSIQELTPELAKDFGIEDGKGVLISSVTPGDPAEKAGLKGGDVIVKFNGSKIDELSELPRTVAATEPGSKVKVVAIRDGAKKVFTLTVGKKEGKEDMEVTEESSDEPEEKFGIAVKSITPSIIERLGLESTVKGVLISSVKSGSPAQTVGLKTGDIIKQVNREPVNDPDEYNKKIKKIKGNRVLLLVQRGKRMFFVSLQIEE